MLAPFDLSKCFEEKLPASVCVVKNIITISRYLFSRSLRGFFITHILIIRFSRAVVNNIKYIELLLNRNQHFMSHLKFFRKSETMLAAGLKKLPMFQINSSIFSAKKKLSGKIVKLEFIICRENTAY